MIGREVPLRTLDEALAAAPRVVLVCGEAGIGKTRLVAEVEAAAGGWLVLHGECVEFGGEELAYAPVVAALRDLPAAWLNAWLDGLSAPAPRALPADWLGAWLDGLAPEAGGALAAVLPHEAPGGGGPGRVLELVLDLLTAL